MRSKKRLGVDDAALRVVFKGCMRGFILRNSLLQTLLIASGHSGELFMKVVDRMSVRVE